jgi:hypothetical protein
MWDNITVRTCYKLVHWVLVSENVHWADYSVAVELCEETVIDIILLNNQVDTQFFFLYVYFNSLHVSSNLVFIIRRINCIHTTPGKCHADHLVRSLGSSFPTCVPRSHLHTLTYSRCCIDTTDSPDDEHLNFLRPSFFEFSVEGFGQPHDFINRSHSWHLLKVRTVYATCGLLDLECKMCSVYVIFNVLWTGTG